jgi:hypothetical protein
MYELTPFDAPWWAPRGATPPELPRGGNTPPMLFVPAPKDPARWEYRVVIVDPREDEPLEETRLTELGAEGWLLAGVVQSATGFAAGKLYYYFVRAA